MRIPRLGRVDVRRRRLGHAASTDAFLCKRGLTRIKTAKRGAEDGDARLDARARQRGSVHRRSDPRQMTHEILETRSWVRAAPHTFVMSLLAHSYLTGWTELRTHAGDGRYFWQ